ncbi:MAG TPA: hypothetical protein VMV33_08800 [Rhodocyclaceae bacterium]|nr:hypothetical protein [Rhodocyclaceae bacterium]
MKFPTLLACAATALLLTGCGNDSASYLINGADHSLTLSRVQPYFWSSAWDLSLVTTHMPDCMRRHRLKPAAMDDFKVELFRTPEDRYILKQGGNWYITETEKCRLQQFQTPPAEPGERLGVFEIKEKRLQFVPAPTSAAPPLPQPPAAAPAAPVAP